MKPPMVPNAGREAEAINFRTVKESQSVDIGASKVQKGTGAGEGGENGEADPFEEFNSGTYDRTH